MTVTDPQCIVCHHNALDHGNVAGCLERDCTCTRHRRAVFAQVATVPDATALPYAGTSGWSGSVTSEARALLADADGTTTQRQAEVLAYLSERGYAGATWLEVAQAAGWHHGQASGTLSVLHKVGKVARLFGDGTPNTTRNRCAVYVLPGYVGHRQTAEHGRKRPTTTEAERDAMAWLRGALDGPGPDEAVTVNAGDLLAVLDALARLS